MRKRLNKAAIYVFVAAVVAFFVGLYMSVSKPIGGDAEFLGWSISTTSLAVGLTAAVFAFLTRSKDMPISE